MAEEIKKIVVPSDAERIAAKKAKQQESQEQTEKFKKGALPKGIRIAGRTEPSGSPKPQLSKKERPKRLPTVRRGASGKAEKIVPVDITKPREKAAPAITPTPTRRKATRSGKKIDRATGRIAVPLVKRGEGGRAVGITPEEKAAAVRTELPKAGPDIMQPAVQAQTMLPKGVLQRGGQRKLRGFPVPHARVKAAVDAAVHHLGNMKSTRGTPEFDQHEKTFDAIHSNIQSMDKHGLGITVGQLKHQTLNNGSPHVLNQLHTMIQDRLEEGRMAESENKQRTQEGRARKAGN